MIEKPKHFAQLPLDENGVPVPWFVGDDFHEKLTKAVTEKRCWTCGRVMKGRSATFMLDPVNIVNRVAFEPPSHRDCVEYFAKSEAFATGDVYVLWSSQLWQPAVVLRHGSYGIVFNIGAPTQHSWWLDGYPAPRDVVISSLEDVLPSLEEQAAKEGTSEKLGEAIVRAMNLAPDA